MVTELSASFTSIKADGLYHVNSVFPQPSYATDDLIITFEQLLQRIEASSNSPQIVDLAQQTLAQLHHIRAAIPLAAISDFVRREFHLRPNDLQSRARDQRLAFVRQLTMYLCRKITGASFPVIGQHFARNHSTVLYAYRFIGRRTARDAAFRTFVEKMTFQIARAGRSRAPECSRSSARNVVIRSNDAQCIDTGPPTCACGSEIELPIGERGG